MTVLAVMLLFVAMAVSASADSELSDIYVRSHQVGARLGGWANQGGTPPSSIGDPPQPGSALTDFSDGNFYLEGFVAYRINPWLATEFSLGLVSRGDATIYESDQGSSYGTVNVYPILLKLKAYPLGTWGDKFHPYVLGGGGVYYGKHSIQIVDSYEGLLRANFGEESQTTLGFVFGGGVDWPLASVIALDLNVQYMQIDFSDPLIAVEDYSSLTITVGVKYLFFSHGKEKR
jgi:opacity protein-like surface antigen